jgi:hypothetical protein
MTDLEMWSGLVAFGLPLLIAVIQQPRFSSVLRVVIMVLSCIVASVVTTALQGDLDWHRWFHSLLVVGIGTIAFYHGVWQPATVAPKVEAATSPGGMRRVHGDAGFTRQGILAGVVLAIIGVVLVVAVHFSGHVLIGWLLVIAGILVAIFT